MLPETGENMTPEFIKKIELFEGFSNLEKETVLDCLKAISLKKEEILFRQGEPGTSLYIIQSGVIGGYIELPNHKHMEVGRFSTGQSFGEMSIVEALPRTITCYAVTDAQLLMLEAIDFYRFVWDHAMIGVKMLKTMTCNMASWLYESNNFLNILVRWGENARLRAITDSLTGLYNKNFLEESVEFAITKYKQTHQPFCLLMMDVDYFRTVNLAWGMEGGDELLKGIAQLMKNVFSDNGVIAKLGGDEFLVLLKNCTFANAVNKANHLLELLKTTRDSLEAGNTPLNIDISMSIGVAAYPVHGGTLLAMLEAADKALYLAKEAGRNTVRVAPFPKSAQAGGQ